MRKQKISFKILVLFILILCQIASVKPTLMYAFVLDSTWTIIDENNTINASLNKVIEDYIAGGYNKFFIKDGTYFLNDTIIISSSNITIYGESRENTKILQGNPYSHGLKITADNVIVENLSIDNSVGKEAVYVSNANQVTVKNCNIYGASNCSAIAYYGTTLVNDIDAVMNYNLNNNNEIINNMIVSPLTVDVKDGIFFSKQMNGKISGNTLIGSRIAFYLSRDCEVSNNTISQSNTNGIRYSVPAYNNKIINNSIYDTDASGILVVRNDTSLTPESYRGSQLEISNNSIERTRYFGIEVSNLENSIIHNNTIQETDFDGIYLLYSDNLSVMHNNINESSLSDQGVPLWTWNSNLNSGIFIDYMVKNCVFSFNNITNIDDCFYGIRIQNGNENINNEITNNVITGDFQEGISANDKSPENTHIQFNTILLKVMKVPKNVNATVSGSSIIVSWDGDSDAKGYEISSDNILKDNGMNTLYEDSNVIENVLHYYKVRFKGGDWSNVVSIMVPKSVTSPITPSPSVGPTVPSVTPSPSVGPTVPSVTPSPSVGPTVPSVTPSPSVGPTVPSVTPSPSVGPTVPSVTPIPSVAPTVPSETPIPSVGPTVPSVTPSPSVGPTVPSETPSPSVSPTVPSETPIPSVAPTVPSETPSPSVGPTAPSETPSSSVAPTVPSETPSPSIIPVETGEAVTPSIENNPNISIPVKQEDQAKIEESEPIKSQEKPLTTPIELPQEATTPVQQTPQLSDTMEENSTTTSTVEKGKYRNYSVQIKIIAALLCFVCIGVIYIKQNKIKFGKRNNKRNKDKK